jgi:hypothetical protein
VSYPMERVAKARREMAEAIQAVDRLVQPGLPIKAEDMRAIFHNIAQALYDVCDALIERAETGL